MANVSVVDGRAGESAMFRGDPAHSGALPGAAPRNLAVKWTFATGEPMVSSPTVANGVVYVGGSDNFLYALAADNGALKWKFDAHGNVSSSAAVSDGMVFVVSLDGKLHAVDAASGAEKWSFSTQGERRHTASGVNYNAPSTETMPDPWDFFLSSPTVVDGVVYFGSGDHHVYAIDAATGSLRWKYKTGNVVHASPALADGVLYIGSFDAYFYALNASTGELIWKFKTKDDEPARLLTGIPGSAAVATGIVYFGCRDGHVYALDARNGRQKWEFSTSNSWVVATPAVHDGRVFFTTSDALKFYALDAQSGKEEYSLSHYTYSFSSPMIVGGRAFFGTFDGKLRVVDLELRQYSGEFAVPGFSQNGPRYLDENGTLKHEAVWIGDTLDDVIMSLRSKVFSLGSILSSPTIVDGVVYFASTDGTVYALGK